MNAEQKRKYDREFHARRSPEKKSRKIELQRKRSREIRERLTEYKRGLSCQCGENHIACLEFHHTGDDKEVNISEATSQGWTFDRIMKEIEKCIVLCANCHRKLHFSSETGTFVKSTSPDKTPG